jgi:hypothetical protein
VACGVPFRGQEGAMLSCDYNGWNDAPEDEREALDGLELLPRGRRSPSARTGVRRFRPDVGAPTNITLRRLGHA